MHQEFTQRTLPNTYPFNKQKDIYICVIYNVFTVYCTKMHLYTHNCTHTQSKIILLPVHVSLLLETGGDRGIDVYGLTIENNKKEEHMDTLSSGLSVTDIPSVCHDVAHIHARPTRTYTHTRLHTHTHTHSVFLVQSGSRVEDHQAPTRTVRPSFLCSLPSPHTSLIQSLLSEHCGGPPPL